MLFALLMSLALGAPPLDLNSATATELAELPGVGPFQAMVLVVSRETYGEYTSWEDVGSLSDVGPGLLKALEVRTQLDTLPGPNIPRRLSTDINEATAETLASFPSIGLATARIIIRDRDDNGAFATCSDLTRIVGIGEPTLMAVQNLCEASNASG
jgi:competence ComEA-like helix-hairpin-helix protein